MKFVITIVLVVIMGYAAFLFANETPWWLFGLGALLAGLLVPQTGWQNWLAGFLGIFILWMFLTWKTDVANNHILSIKMATLLPLSGSPAAIMIVSAFIGGLVGGFAAMTGGYIRPASK